MTQFVLIGVATAVGLGLLPPLANPQRDPLHVAKGVGSAQAKESDRASWQVRHVAANIPAWPALAPPVDFRFTGSEELGKSTMTGRWGELAMQWSPVIGARTYAIQFCESKQCRAATKKIEAQNPLAEEEPFRDLAIVGGTTYLAWGLRSGKQYWFRVVGIDAQGQRGDYSVVLIRSAP
jgi:hypothetical protein